MNGNRSLSINVIFLMIKLFIALAANLYISRQVLTILGVSEYGIFNIVNGTVLLATSLTGSLSSAVTRFINFEMGKNNVDNVSSIFSISVFIHIIISLIILSLSYFFSSYIVTEFLNIPHKRWESAENVLHITSLSLVCVLMSVSFISLIISNENMKEYTFIGLIEVCFKLVSVKILESVDFDKLELYSYLLFFVNLAVLIVYIYFCRTRYRRINFKLSVSISYIRKLLSFVGWNAIGSASFILKDYGVNILLNVFFGPIINAAKGIAFQLCVAIQTVVNNLVVAVNPRITKLYAEGNKDKAVLLMLNFSRYSFSLAVLLAFPLYCYASYILELWLGNVPDYTVVILKLMLLNLVIDSFSAPLITMMLAIGNIKWYQIIVGGINFLNLPLSYVSLKYGGSVESTIYISIFLSIVCLFLRLYMVGESLRISIFKSFFYQIRKLLIWMILNCILYFSMYYEYSYIKIDIFVFFVFFVFQCLSLWFFAFNKNEKKYIYDRVSGYL
ncbi:hypothetical protein C9J21_19850 [Photobacterium phosphoreum]|uniref:MATE family efflux transporter n=1 Tax=Photobacterium phosphoreum TaxID=659 RepID=UPI000D179BB9|nr:MATE family efflux transporter [Photobacterium phosphoreum]PSW29358.1 hypothetical protein C9J21_19850 [Photobacterium phosphoreum]